MAPVTIREEFKPCTAEVQVNGEFLKCICFAGEGHSTSDYDHIVEVSVRTKVPDGEHEDVWFKTAKATITWQ